MKINWQALLSFEVCNQHHIWIYKGICWLCVVGWGVGLDTQCSAQQAFGLVWSTGEARCQVWDSRTAESPVRTTCTVLSSLSWESVQTNLFPSWLQCGSGHLKESVLNDPLPEASTGALHLFLGFLVVQWSRISPDMDGTDGTPEKIKKQTQNCKTASACALWHCMLCWHMWVYHVYTCWPAYHSRGGR